MVFRKKKHWTEVNKKLYSKKSEAKRKQRQYKNMGYNVRVVKRSVPVGTSKKHNKVKGYKVEKQIGSYRVMKDKSRR